MTTPLDPRPVSNVPAGPSAGSTSASPREARPGDPRGAGPIPKEIAVVATGARPGGSGGPRELFCEDTTTVLVFEKGAVIRLSVAVVPGQLIFLTNLQTKKEVVAQVMLKGSTQTNNTYADLQFTEEAPDYWGVQFPKSEDGAGAISAASGAQSTHPSGTTFEHPGLEMAAPAAEEVEKLREEVEELRQKLASLAPVPAQPQQTSQAATAPQAAKKTEQSAAPHAVEAPLPDALTAAVLAAASSPPKPPVEKAQKSTAENVAGGPATALTDALLAAATAVVPKQPAIAVRDALPTMALPKAKATDENSPVHSRADAALGSLVHQSEGVSEEGEILPEASLDFDGAPQEKTNRKARAVNEMAIPSLGGRTSKPRLALLCAALALCGAGAAWYEHWLPRVIAAELPAPETLFSFHGAASAAPRARPAATIANQPKPVPAAKSVAAPADSTAEVVHAISAQRVKPESEEPKERVREDAPTAKEEDAPREAVSEKRDASGDEARVRPASAAVHSDAAASNEPFVGPRLLKSVRPVAPAKAIRSFVTGNVEVEAQVSAEGHVTSAKALSGPDALLDAAVATVKQYKYAPAKRGGKAVPAQVKVTVQFWYEP